MIQLKVRTEFSFKETFAPLARVVERLKLLGATAAGCVDLGGSTWGHVRWEKELLEAGIEPMFGAEFVVVPDPAKASSAPTAWVLATDPSALYELSSRAHLSTDSGRPTLSVRDFLDAPGVVRFAGSALAGSSEAAEAGVYLDVNPGSILATRAALATARRVSSASLVITGDNLFPSPKDRKIYELAGRASKSTPQHILSLSEMRGAFAMQLTPEQIEGALHNAAEIAAIVRGVRLPRAPLIKVEGDVEALCRLGIKKRLKAKQIAKWTPEYEARLQRELQLVKEKEFDSYFLVVADLIVWAKKRMMVGPARGSSAGSLMCYLMEITEVDPLPFGLLFERFVDITRTDLPDIDIDFPDSKRDSVYEYLREKYGADRVARIGTISEYKAKSALVEVSKRLRIPIWETAAVKDAMFVRSSADTRANNCLLDTLEQTGPGRALVEKFPAVLLSAEIEGHASHSGVHAAGVIVCNEPIAKYCSVSAEGVAQLDKIDAEKLNLLKIDALGLRTMTVIEDSGVITQDALYKLKFDDPRVFEMINSGRFSGIFQWEGQALQGLTEQITLGRFEDMAHITALARPGPLGGGAAQRFVARHRGEERTEVAHPSMLPYLAETFGLVLYQEQVIRISREIGKLSWDDTTALRKAMSKSYGKEFFDKYAAKFVEGAATIGMKKGDAMAVWDQINSMGAWSFNKSHAVAYAIISYWTAWLKVHHPLQFAAASLRNAKDDETAMSLLREMVEEGVEYIPFDVDLSEENWSVKDGKLVGGFLGLKGIGAKTAGSMLAEREKSGKLSDKQRAKLDKAKLIFGDLYPAHTMWGAYYSDPESMGLQRGTVVSELSNLPEWGEVVVLGQLKSKDHRDKNEDRLIERRQGKRATGQTQFLDMRLSDDSSLAPLLCRIDIGDFEPTGRLLLDRAKEDHHWFLIRGEKLKGFPMIQVYKIKCLNEPDLLTEHRKAKESV